MLGKLYEFYTENPTYGTRRMKSTLKKKSWNYGWKTQDKKVHEYIKQEALFRVSCLIHNLRIDKVLHYAFKT